MTIREIASVTSGEVLQTGPFSNVRYLLFDSRRPLIQASASLFFAVQGIRHDGHDFIQDLYSRGVRMFVVEKKGKYENMPEAAIVQVESAVRALQQVARARREAFHGEVIGITGSNGKTIVKEWLFQLLSPFRHVIKSPSSYNSQIGVPLSIWQLRNEHETGIFEAGISAPGEMDNLREVIRPGMGIFTNIGSAHDEGFADRQHKISEKMRLFRDSRLLIYCRDHEDIHAQVTIPSFSWGYHAESDLRIEESIIAGRKSELRCSFGDQVYMFSVPFTDPASVENAMHVIACLLALDMDPADIQAGLSRLRPLRMRLEMKQGQHGCYVIDDTYNNDLAGLRNALEFLNNVSQGRKKSLILSDILQSGLPDDALVTQINELVKAAGLHTFIGIGPVLSKYRGMIENAVQCYPDTSAFLRDSPASKFQDEVILIKGARPFHFESVVQKLEEKIHGTVLEVDLGALTHNLNYFRTRLSPGVKVMVMVKAFAYGAGSMEVANLLQYHRVDYLGVAYADEGLYLRRNGIHLPIMVMNPTQESFENMIENDLEPEIYSLKILHELAGTLGGRTVGIHLKLDTGMHRLGFAREDLPGIPEVLGTHPGIEVKSIFSHLAAAESGEHEAFSREQARRFTEMSEMLMAGLPGKPLRHLLNSPGIIRYPEYQFDMVRLGIGLYGIESNNLEQGRLEPVSTLSTVISQVREVPAGESVGYGRRGQVETDRRIATIAIGYADGFGRILGNGRGSVFVKGKRAPVIGNVCMDMTMIDITGIEAGEGDRVEIFGPNLPLTELADMSDTIPYEILTNVSQRVKRVFFSD